MLQILNVIKDRGSRYAVSGGPVRNTEDIAAFLKTLKSHKKFAKATHNSWAASLCDGPQRNDDGEAGAAAAILRMLEREGLTDHIVVVTRWYGGTHLGGDRFRHVTSCTRAYLEALAKGV
ncbi:YigZ family protein [Pseudorhodobacter turbinis]|uniref:YigZ family protein n=1 Tax=Pseudorhodobacter turbinis TaxID=2500533 RepID=A0A4P8EHU5_9RHOB|nr:YigZ family protein [Pseudorhodobacter turbinis]QCO56333.1 YigZ family protein [Pseudorhodobacter turbinis]